jgi:hypothetical protein
MIKLVKDRESWLFNQSWYIRNTSSILPIRDKKRSTSSMNKLAEILMACEVNPCT